MNGYNRVVFVLNNNGSLSIKKYNNIQIVHKSIQNNKKIITKQPSKKVIETNITDKSNSKEIMNIIEPYYNKEKKEKKEKKENNISYIQIGQSTIPNAPFLWYRENHLFCPFEKINKVTKQDMNKILMKHNIENKYNAIDNYIVVHNNVINNANIYVSFHGYAYSKDHINNVNINNITKKFNKNYIFHSILKPITESDKTTRIPLFGPPIKKDLNPGIIFATGNNNYKNNAYIKGSVHIHDLALSPPNNFKFNINDNKDYTMLLVHGYSEKIKSANCLCLFVIINAHKITDNTKIKEINKIIDDIIKE